MKCPKCDQQMQAHTYAGTEVDKCSNGVTYVGKGHFMYPSETGHGFWTPAVMPEIPDELYRAMMEILAARAEAEKEES